MKILLSINSCVKFARNGSNQALRDTWLQSMAKYYGVDYKFFIGDGTPTYDDDIMLSKLGDCPPRFAGVEKHQGEPRRISPTEPRSYPTC